jgi:hypothetical protein
MASGRSIGKSVGSTSSSPSKYIRTRLSYPSAYRILESPNHRACVETNLARIPKGSQAVSPLSTSLEKRWDNRFQVAFSKDNHKVYPRLREYFDSPRKFDEGILYQHHNRSMKNTHRTDRRNLKGLELRRKLDWTTRYMASSEWNEVKHKTLRSYFDEMPNASLF